MALDYPGFNINILRAVRINIMIDKLPIWLRVIVLVISFPSFPISASAGSYESGIEALNSHEYRKAIKILRPLASGGNVNAQYQMGLIYKKGLAVPKNESQMIEWFEAAAKQGHSAAQLEIDQYRQTIAQDEAKLQEKMAEHYEKQKRESENRRKFYRDSEKFDRDRGKYYETSNPGERSSLQNKYVMTPQKISQRAHNIESANPSIEKTLNFVKELLKKADIKRDDDFDASSYRRPYSVTNFKFDPKECTLTESGQNSNTVTTNIQLEYLDLEMLSRYITITSNSKLSHTLKLRWTHTNSDFDREYVATIGYRFDEVIQLERFSNVVTHLATVCGAKRSLF